MSLRTRLLWCWAASVRQASGAPIATAAITLSMIALALAACRGCSSSAATEADAAPSDASPDSGHDVRPDEMAAGGDATSDANDGAIPPDAPLDGWNYDIVPPDWQAWTDWSDQCPIYVPGPNGAMPPPIQWEPCPPPYPQTIVCRRMKNSWGGSTTPFPRFWRDPETGAAVLLFSRMRPGSDTIPYLRLVAEADGRIRTTQFYMASSKCQYLEHDINDGRYILHALTQTGPSGADGGPTREEGAVGGEVDAAAPSVLLRLGPAGFWTSNFAISSRWIGQLSAPGINAWSWDAKTNLVVYKLTTDPDGLEQHVPIVRGPDMFFSVGDLNLCGTMSWNPDAGLRPLLRWYQDTTHGSGNLGTDGTDMVWTQIQGTAACSGAGGPTPETWTAPYTTDPSVLKTTARKLRSDGVVIGPYPYAVGFGYAALTGITGSPPVTALVVVRLSDGYRWVLSSGSDQSPGWSTPIGITLEELFVPAFTPDMQGTVVRIQLDSLGPGEPPS